MALAPRADSSALALRAAFTASIQYFWVSRLDVQSSEKLIMRRNWLALGTSSGARSERTIDLLHDLVGLLIVKISMHPVVKRYLAYTSLACSYAKFLISSDPVVN